MLLETKFFVPHQVYLDAKHYVERKHVEFFDFYRGCSFGYVRRINGKGGYFVHLVQGKDSGELTGYCSCGESDDDEVCGHAFALFLKIIDWPFEKKNLSEDFENYPLVRFFRKVGNRLHGKLMHADTNPSLTLPEDIAPERMMKYWGFALGENQLTRRDRKSLDRARRLCRSAGEVAMLRKGFPSALVQFEESQLYNLCKLLYFRDYAEGLSIRVRIEPDHQVRLTIRAEDKQLFDWLMPIGVYLKGVQEDKKWWVPHADFEVQQQGVPITYRIGFTDDNRLEIEPRILVAEGHHIGLDEAPVPGARGLYYHPEMGYFRIQTGLSPFEMEYSDPGIEIVPHEKVKAFLNQHRATLQGLDRTLMDDSVFGEVVAEHFEALDLKLVDFEDGYFGYEMTAALGDHSFDTDTLRDLFRESGRYHKLAGKLFDAAGYDGVYLRPLYDTDRDDGRLHVSDLFRMMAFFKGRLTVSTNELTEKVYADLKSFEGAPPPELTETNLNLRDYQKIGYEWLYFLRSFGLGGLLCDQMGLGKTHQGMALLSAVLAEKAEARVLVIAPTSVIYHWKDKLQTFCPKVGASIYHGADRRPQSTLQRFQVMISTYGTLRNDYDYFQDHLFDLILFDEIQNLKNKDTKMYKGLSRLKARCKIGLTGTPIENHITELKSLMDLVFPGYLGSDAQFRKFFADPIVKYNSDHAKEQVRGMIKPFILRRKKSEVLLELPEKTEDMRTFKLGEYERELYKEVKEKGKKLLAEDPDNKMHIFGLITHLKMVCDHPALYFKNADYSAYPSAKWMLFKELLEEAMDSGEKVVVFTQYLGMVDIITHYLGSQGIGYASITGATRDRRREQSRFMEDEDCRVFVGSIKAAGVGIDLTSASIAIHYDRWWNPAVEEQATDRIHRIGQKKNVQVYKFVGVDTVEQRIDAIISRKRGLLEDVVGFDSDSVGKTLTMDELLEILS